MSADQAPLREEDWKDDDFLSFHVKPYPEKEEYDSMAEDDDMETSTSSDEEDDTGNQIPPWIYPGFPQNIHPLTALHNEIVSFANLLEPLPSEIDQRNNLVQRLRDTVQTHFGDTAKLEVFGSQATGLFLPTSDIDLVLITEEGGDDNDANNKKDPPKESEQGGYDPSLMLSPIDRFANAIEKDWYDELSYLEKVEKTRIPLVKFTHAPTNISVDVSFNQESGGPAAKLMRSFLEALPPLRPLTFVLKYFLAARDLSTPYTGGMGSYMLQLLIVAYLQQRERDAVNFERPSAYNLGALLLEFLEFYGLDFNYLTTGISVRHDGFFFPKGASDRREIYWRPSNPAMLALENPLDPTYDVGQSSYRYQMVQRAFAVAYRTLLAQVTPPRIEGPSLLSTILPTTSYMTRRLVLKRRDQALSCSRDSKNKVDRALGSKSNLESAGFPRKRQK